MNVATAFVWLMSAGVLAIAAVPQRQEAIPRQADGASAAPAKPEMKWEREDTGQRRRVVLASPYEARRQSNPQPPVLKRMPLELVDTMVVSTLPDQRESPMRAEAPSSDPSKAVPVAPRSRASAVKRDHRRQAKDNAPAGKSISAGVRLSRAGDNTRAKSHSTVATIDQRP